MYFLIKNSIFAEAVIRTWISESMENVINFIVQRIVLAKVNIWEILKFYNFFLGLFWWKLKKEKKREGLKFHDHFIVGLFWRKLKYEKS